MKKLFFIFQCLAIVGLFQNLNAQTEFQQITDTPFEGVRDGDIALADVNGNGNLDVLIIGQNNEFEEVTKLYLNQGDGKYLEVVSTPFVGVELGSVAFADVNNNGMKDVLITGLTSTSQPIAKLYINNGNGNFVENTNTSFEGAYYSSIAFADVDSNGSQDVLITGLNSSLKPFTKLYINDGKGDFKEKNTNIEAVSSGSLAFADVNGNAHLDVLITGKNAKGEAVTKLYINNTKGSFNEVATPFANIANGDVAFADFNGNGNLDVIITGFSNERISKLYINKGEARYEEVKNTPFEAVSQSSILIADVNQDGNLDVIINGQNNSNIAMTKLYINDEAGKFVTNQSSVFDNLVLHCMAIAQTDGHHDLLMMSQNVEGFVVSNLYRK